MNTVVYAIFDHLWIDYIPLPFHFLAITTFLNTHYYSSFHWFKLLFPPSPPLPHSSSCPPSPPLSTPYRTLSTPLSLPRYVRGSVVRYRRCIDYRSARARNRQQLRPVLLPHPSQSQTAQEKETGVTRGGCETQGKPNYHRY